MISCLKASVAMTLPGCTTEAIVHDRDSPRSRAEGRRSRVYLRATLSGDLYLKMSHKEGTLEKKCGMNLCERIIARLDHQG